MRANHIYGKIAELVNGFSINFYYLRYFYPKCSKCFKCLILIIRFLRKKFFVLKFLFIEVIHSIYLILAQYAPALLLMYYNTQKSKATHNT